MRDREPRGQNLSETSHTQRYGVIYDVAFPLSTVLMSGTAGYAIAEGKPGLLAFAVIPAALNVAGTIFHESEMRKENTSLQEQVQRLKDESVS